MRAGPEDSVCAEKRVPAGLLHAPLRPRLQSFRASRCECAICHEHGRSSGLPGKARKPPCLKVKTKGFGGGSPTLPLTRWVIVAK